MHASVCAPATISRPTPRSASTCSRSVASNESPYCLCTTGSSSACTSSGTYFHSSLSRGSPSSLCCTQTTGTLAARALSTSVATLATSASRPGAPPTTPFCTSTTSRAVLVRLSSVVTAPP